MILRSKYRGGWFLSSKIHGYCKDKQTELNFGKLKKNETTVVTHVQNVIDIVYIQLHKLKTSFYIP
jgi:hypothetical protein